MKAELYNIKSIFKKPENIKFKIPSFQRRFVLDRDNVLDMFDDFDEDSNNYNFKSVNELDGYLMGSIVLINSNNSSEYIVVDGQQRLTTLSLIFKSMSYRYDKLMDENKTKIKRKNKYLYKYQDMEYFFFTDPVNDELRIKQNTDLSYAKVYKDIISDCVDNKDKNDYEDNNILEVWEEINNQINNFSDDKLNKFDEYLQENVKLIRIECPNRDQALQLFEVLNNRGQSLEPLDLIKNMFLQLVDGKENVRDFNKHWGTFSENMYIRKNHKGKTYNHSSLFLKYFIMSYYGENQKRKQLVEFFRDKIKKNRINKDNVLNIVEKFSDYSKIYKNMIENPSKNKFSDSSYMYSLSLLKVKQFHQLLMVFYFTEYASKEQLQKVREQVLLACIKMGLSTLYNHDLPNEIEKAMPSIVRAFKDSLSKTKSLDEATNSMIEVMKQYNEEKQNSIIATLPYLKLGNKKASDLLKIFEVLFNKNNGITTKQAPGKKITLEHILPQSRPNDIKKLGFDDDDDYYSTINSIGNLTLLHHDDNDSLNNESFSKKIIVYGNTDLNITKAINGKYKSNVKASKDHDRIETLTKYYERSYTNEWNKDLIKQRGRELSKLLVAFTTDKLDNWFI